MARIVVAVVLFLLINYSFGFIWVSLKSGDAIPLNAILIDGDRYVGRARHYDEILLAEVNSTCATVRSCEKSVVKNQYEVLVGRNTCSWEIANQLDDIPANIVRGGTAANGKPIFIGREYYQERRKDYGNYDELRRFDGDYGYSGQLRRFDGDYGNNGELRQFDDDYGNNEVVNSIEPIYLGSSVYPYSHGSSRKRYILVCEDDNTWVDTSAKSIPSDAISGGKSDEGNEVFVARLKSLCSIIPGQVTPKLGIASAVTETEEDIRSNYCQVLVGDSKMYNWVESHDGAIPDYAVVGSKSTDGQLMYVARINKTVGYVVQSNITELGTNYEVLVRNVQ